jgi:cytochrome c556
MLRLTVVMVGLAALTAAGCKTAEAPKMSAAEAIEARQKLMKEQGAAFKNIQDKAKAGQITALAPDAETLVSTSRRITSLFVEGSVNPEKSRAKPEIWQKWSEFEGNAKRLETKAGQLAATARSGNAEATNAAIADLGKTTCGACHNAFRGPEIKK